MILTDIVDNFQTSGLHLNTHHFGTKARAGRNVSAWLEIAKIKGDRQGKIKGDRLTNILLSKW